MLRYPEYKDSGIEWIGDIPKHWIKTHLKYVVTFNDDVLPEDTDPDFEFQYIEISDVDQSAGIRIGNKISFSDSPSRARRMLRVNDVLISTVRTYLRAIGTIPETGEFLVASTGFCVLRATSSISWSFLSFLVMTEQFISAVVANSEGVSYPAISSTDLVRLSTPLPPLQEQDEISKYLHQKTSQIDSLTEKLERKIELLKEYRTSLISHCVTKGLDSDVEMKNSGVEYIGEIPKHWIETRLKYVVTFNDDVLPEDTDPDFEFQYIEISDVDQSAGIRIGNKISFSDSPSRARRMLRVNDVLISTVRTYLRAIGTIPETGEFLVASTGFCVLRATSSISWSFLSFLVMTEQFISAVVANSEGVSYPAISSTDLVRLSTPLPPLQEQDEISKYLHQKTSQIDSLTEKLERKIELLKEYCQSLISNVVTGKIRVAENM